jgi:hypothetical protein
MMALGAFLLFPFYALGYILGYLFEILAFGFTNGRKGLD